MIATSASLRGLLVFTLLGVAAVTGCLAWRGHVEQARAAEAEQADRLARIDLLEAVHRVEREHAALMAAIDRIEFALAMLDRSVDGARGQGACHYRSDAERRAARERLAELRRERDVLRRASPDWARVLRTPGAYDAALFDGSRRASVSPTGRRPPFQTGGVRSSGGGRRTGRGPNPVPECAHRPSC